MEETTSRINNSGYVSPFLLPSILKNIKKKINDVFAGLIDKEIVNTKVSTTSLSLFITQYNFNNSVENEKKSKPCKS